MSLLGMAMWKILLRMGVSARVAALSSAILLIGYGILIENP